MVPRLDMCRSILSLSKIAHQMWRDHPFNQRNRTIKRTVGVKVGGYREAGRGDWTKFEKRGSRKYRGVFIRKKTLKISHPPIIKPTTHSWLPLISSKNFHFTHFLHTISFYTLFLLSVMVIHNIVNYKQLL